MFWKYFKVGCTKVLKLLYAINSTLSSVNHCISFCVVNVQVKEYAGSQTVHQCSTSHGPSEQFSTIPFSQNRFLSI